MPGTPAGAQAISAEASLCFLTQAPWLTVSPGLASSLVVLPFNLVGDGLRDAPDPRGK